MVTAKLRAIYKLIRADHVTLFTKRADDKFDGISFGRGDLSDLFLMAIEMKRIYNDMIAAANDMAAETGELHALQELKEALDKYDEE